MGKDREQAAMEVVSRYVTRGMYNNILDEIFIWKLIFYFTVMSNTVTVFSNESYVDTVLDEVSIWITGIFQFPLKSLQICDFIKMCKITLLYSTCWLLLMIFSQIG